MKEKNTCTSGLPTMALVFRKNRLHIFLSDVEVNANVITVTENVRGTHDGVLDLSLLKGPVVEPTHRPIAFVMGRVEFTVENGQIAAARDIMTPSPEVGVPGLLKQIGYLPDSKP